MGFMNTPQAGGQELRQQLSTRAALVTPPADQIELIAAPIPRGSGIHKLILNMPSKGKSPALKSQPVAPYLGGKRNLAKRVTAIIDAHDHHTYAEPFVGMGGIFLRRSQKPRAEFINDRGRDVYNLFRILQEHYVAFLDMLRYQITTQAGFNRLIDTDPATLTDLQRAARFLYLQRCAFGGKVSGKNFGLSVDRPARFNLNTLEPDLEAVHARLSGVTVMCIDYAEFIRRIDRPTAFFYLDPPYWGCENDYGREMFARDDFAALSKQLRKLKGSFLLSINDVPEIRALFSWAQITPVQTTYSVMSGKPAGKAAELLIANWDIEPANTGGP